MVYWIVQQISAGLKTLIGLVLTFSGLTPQKQDSLRSRNWIFPIINEGRKRVLKEEDLYETSKYHTSEYLGDQFQKEWNKELEKRKSSILKALLRFVGWKYLIIILLVLIQVL
ncbi:multidrug resistance-associated protein 4-like [Centruroides sculpturatus]|uniref:multidrug resistance-associated protein 4-like n=1 Tax=Centruroides sculpturatus TaxID=218467 RepID=UPI000C6DC168|nr:multidrug resistance-associated protein 4-like [Centruroides sculpturatus]